METTNYPAPVDTLLTYGPIKLETVDEWPEYLALGFSAEHIPDLVRMAKDETLRYKYFDDDAYPDFNEDEHPEYWAPIHAVHTLGALHATSASESLLPLFDEAIKFHDEWMSEDLPDVYSMFGPEAISLLASYIAETGHDDYATGYAIEALKRIATRHPDARGEVVAALTKQLEFFEENSNEFNASLIAGLAELKAVEAAPLIERAFAADKVDIVFIGDWDEVQVLLGLQTTQQLDDKRRAEWSEEVAQREKEYTGNADSANSSGVPTRSHSNKQSMKKKAKAKMAKASRKKNKARK